MGLRRLLAPAVAAATALAVLSGCANGGGLRVEGAEPAVEPSVTRPATPTPASSSSPGVRKSPAQTVPLAQVRTKLLADKALDAWSRDILVNCTVIVRCLSQGPSVDVMHSGVPQQVVYIHTLDKFVFGAFLIALDAPGPRRIWSMKVDQPTIRASRQGDLVVEWKVFTLDDRPCCPSGSKAEVYRWNGRQMVRLSSTDQKGD
ncbi:hypothetical protein HPO96_06990 [Kribbella sandramycini]|uniref:LppP/LprE lipoprotein n=1 Tax=Kribbella sandramycini TaxID=60450 RepID=A0A7Y4KWP0_9ACTN|nr:hypothetical protein [Kribbella sandramycini]MBB6567403.1 hypothetical protein [Kribbella sandramycini]NOL39984.1 hypothetical protein [Kribbella sandramycini]